MTKQQEIYLEAAKFVQQHDCPSCVAIHRVIADRPGRYDDTPYQFYNRTMAGDGRQLTCGAI